MCKNFAEYEDENLEDDFYLDWLSDNIIRLRQEFCLEEEDKFNEYCKEVFKQEDVRH